MVLFTRVLQCTGTSLAKQLSSRATLRSCASAAGDASSQQVVNSKSVAQTGFSRSTVVAAAALGLLGGIVASNKDAQLKKNLTPPGGFKMCCETQLTEDQVKLPQQLKLIVGSGNVSSNVKIRGSRLGQGTAMAVVKPGTLQEAIDVLKACVLADVAILPQGANTSLTGGSVPRDDQSDRPCIVVNMRRLRKILPVGADSKQVLCFAGAGIFDLQELMKGEYNRDSHSVLGSIFLNPSVAAGVSYGSGGTQIRKGPAFTERALFLRVRINGDIELVDTLGLNAKGPSAVSFLEAADKLESKDFDASCTAVASWPDYPSVITKFDGMVSRYNADTTGIDCNRSEGKVMILATLHDTWPMPTKTRLAWVSTRDFEIAHEIKKDVCLSSHDTMSRSCEYMNRDICDAADQGGRILIKMIEVVGMKNLEPLWNLKLLIESIPLPFTDIICDKFLWWFNGILPKSLPAELQQHLEEYEHHMLMEFSEYSVGEMERLEQRLLKFQASKAPGDVKIYFCDDAFSKSRATLFRFSMAPAFRTFCVGMGMQGLSIDYSSPKNSTKVPTLPEKDYPISKRCIYGHFGCNVFHEDLVFAPGIEVDAAKTKIKKAVEATGGKLPAEHGHGTEYHAPPETQKRWQNMDPMNSMNPGVGGTSWRKGYAPCACAH